MEVRLQPRAQPFELGVLPSYSSSKFDLDVRRPRVIDEDEKMSLHVC